MSLVARVAFGLFSAVFAIYVVGGLVLGSEWEVEREDSIAAPPAAIFPKVNRLPEWRRWTVWNEERYPGLEVTHEGPAEGVGAVQRWTDGDREGVITITGSEPDRRVAYELTMDDGEIAMDCAIELEGQDGETGVRWSCRGESGPGLTARWMMFFFRPLVGNDFALALERLEALVEAELG